MEGVTEDRIDRILLDRGAYSSADSVHPVDGTATWFQDELGQNWVKFKSPQRHVGEEGYRTQVWNANRVICVEYLPRSLENHGVQAETHIPPPTDPGKQSP